MVRLATWTSPALDFGSFDFGWKRAAIWRHQARNQAIAAVIDAIRSGDDARLAPLNLLPAAADPALLHQPRVAVLVESPDHARELAALLDNHQVLAGKSVQTPVSLDRAIVTLVHARSLPTWPVDFLIRVDGTSWPLDLRALDSLSGRSETTPLTIIDLDDHFDDVSRQATRTRVRDYRSRGWEISGAAHDLNSDPALQRHWSRRNGPFIWHFPFPAPFDPVSFLPAESGSQPLVAEIIDNLPA